MTSRKERKDAVINKKTRARDMWKIVIRVKGQEKERKMNLVNKIRIKIFYKNSGINSRWMAISADPLENPSRGFLKVLSKHLPRIPLAS
jgi:hypothetical protein